MAAILVCCFALAFGFEERSRDAWAPAVASHTLAAGLAWPALAAVRPLAAIDDDGHVRVVLVVLDHLVEELVGELTRDHAVDHRSKCRTGNPEERSSRLAASRVRLELGDLRNDASVGLDP